jgi:hypothetical protein
MTDELRTLLLASDSATGWDFPEGFTTAQSLEAVRDVRDVQEEIEAALQIRPELREDFQDASLLALLSLILPDQSLIQIHFSNFGNLTTVSRLTGSSWTAAVGESVDLITGILERYNFVFVPFEALDSVYDGVNKGLRRQTTWFGRFFDYL